MVSVAREALVQSPVTMIAYLLGISEEAVNGCDSSGRTALFYAIYNNHFEAVEVLLEHSAEKINDRFSWADFTDITVLHFSIQYDLQKMISVLLKYGADVTLKWDGEYIQNRKFISRDNLFLPPYLTFTKISERRGFVALEDLCKLVSKNNSWLRLPLYNANWLQGIERTTVIQCWSRDGYLEGLKALAKVCPEEAFIRALNLPNDTTGRTALHYAVARGRVDVVEWLLEHKGIDLTLQDNKGKTAYQLATEGRYVAVKMLLNDLKPVTEKENDKRNDLEVSPKEQLKTYSDNSDSASASASDSDSDSEEESSSQTTTHVIKTSTSKVSFFAPLLDVLRITSSSSSTSRNGNKDDLAVEMHNKL